MTALERPPRTPAREREQPAALCVLVGAAVVVGWVVYRHYWFFDVSQRVFQWHLLGRSMWVAQLIQVLLLLVPYGVVLVLWGRDLGKSLAGAAITLVTAVYVATLTYVFQRWVYGLSGDGFNERSMRAFDWSDLLVVAVLVPLAWGVARRRGRAWALGLVAGPVVAAILYEVQWHSQWWSLHVMFNAHPWSWMVQAAAFVAPFLAAVLAGWAIEARGRRTPK